MWRPKPFVLCPSNHLSCRKFWEEETVHEVTIFFWFTFSVIPGSYFHWPNSSIPFVFLVQFEMYPSSAPLISQRGRGFCSLRVWDVIRVDECFKSQFPPVYLFHKEIHVSGNRTFLCRLNWTFEEKQINNSRLTKLAAMWKSFLQLPQNWLLPDKRKMSNLITDSVQNISNGNGPLDTLTRCDNYNRLTNQ